MALRPVCKRDRILERAAHVLVTGTDLVRVGERKKTCGYFLFLGLCGEKRSSQVLMKQPTKLGIKIPTSQMKLQLKLVLQCIEQF